MGGKEWGVIGREVRGDEGVWGDGRGREGRSGGDRGRVWQERFGVSPPLRLK